MKAPRGHSPQNPRTDGDDRFFGRERMESALLEVEASLEEAFAEFRGRVFHTVIKLTAPSSGLPGALAFKDVHRSAGPLHSKRPLMVERTMPEAHDKTAQSKLSTSSSQAGVKFADPESCTDFAEWAARLELQYGMLTANGTDDDDFEVFHSEASTSKTESRRRTSITMAKEKLSVSSENSAALLRKSLQPTATCSQMFESEADSETEERLGSRLSIGSNESMADLRAELDKQRQKDGKIWRPVNLRRFTSFFSRATERFEAKPLHFERLAFQRMGSGTMWQEIPIRDQVKIIREELTPKFCLVDPESGLMKFWDLITVGCLVFTALVCPYEIAFLDFGYDAVYVLNHIIDVIFLYDMFLQFFLKVQIRTRQGKIWVRERRRIAMLYLKTWFVVDLISIIPYDDISNIASDGRGADTPLEHLKLMRLLRVLRLFKLTRMLKASRLAKRWEDRISLLSSSRFLVKCCILVLVAIHWMACIWGFVGLWEGSNLKCRGHLEADDPLASATGDWFVEPDRGQHNNPSAWHGQSWVVSFALNRASENPINPCSHPLLYLVSVYWAIMTMTSIGYGDILPQVLSEYIICSACMMVSGILWAYIVGAASAVLSNMYPEVTEFEQKMDAFNSMVEDLQVPKKIRLRGREYIRECRTKVHYERNLQAIQSLGMDLQSHISKQKAELHLSKVALFNNCSVLFCGDCAAKMVPMFFEQREVLQLSNQLCVVERGAVGHCGRVLVPWSHWGEDFIVANEMLQSRAPVIAINNAMVVSLSRACADDVLVHHPYERRLFRKAAVRMAFKAAMRIYCFEIRAQEMMPEHVWLHELIEASSNLVSHGVGKRGSSLRSSTGSSLRGSTGSTGSTTNEQVDALVDHFRNSLTSRTSAPDHMMTKNDLFCRLLEAMAPTQEEHLQPLPFPSPDPSRVHTGPVTPPHSPRVQAVREASTIKMRTPRPINAPRAAMVNR